MACVSAEIAVRPAVSEPTEAERERAGAERHEEDDGADEGWSAVDNLFFCFCFFNGKQVFLISFVFSLCAQCSADVVHNEAEQVLSELLRSMERLQELLEEVMDQANQEKMGHAQEVTDSLEAEIKELKKRDTEMKDLASCEDNIYYLQVGRTVKLTEWQY